MDIKIRNLDPIIVKKIDEIAKMSGQSRQEFLKNNIETLSVVEELEKQSEKFIETMNQVIVVLEENTFVMKQLREELLLN